MGRGSNACNTVYRRRQQRCGLKCACGVICNLQRVDLQMPFWSKTIIEPPLFFHGSFYSRAYFKGTLKFWDQYVRDLKISNIYNILAWKDIEVSFLTLCLVCLFFVWIFWQRSFIMWQTVKRKNRISSNAEALTMQVWMKSSSYQLDGRDNHILQTRNVEWQSKCLKMQANVKAYT